MAHPFVELRLRDYMVNAGNASGPPSSMFLRIDASRALPWNFLQDAACWSVFRINC